MDPVTRRTIWQTLQQRKQNRVTLLTTHYMGAFSHSFSISDYVSTDFGTFRRTDEADVLGDRVGVMHTGSLKCLGSPLFLKNRYGAGYDLSLTRDTDRCDDAAVLAFVQRHIASASLKETQGNDMSIQLPFGQESLFPDLFTDLDGALAELSVRGYGVAVTTLEQVFLRITEDHNASDADVISATDASVGMQADFCAAVPSMVQRDLIQQLQAMLRKQCVALCFCMHEVPVIEC